MMGLQRIVIDTYTYEELAVKVAKIATDVAKAIGLSVTESKVISHPGQPDEKTIEVYNSASGELA